MGRPPAPCGTFTAYKRHKRNGEEPCEKCRAAAKVQSRMQTDRKNLRPPSSEILAQMPVESLPADRVSVLKQALVKVSKAIDVVLETDPAKLAPLLREQREISREIDELAGAESKEASLADQLAEARANRAARASAAVSPGAGGLTG